MSDLTSPSPPSPSTLEIRIRGLRIIALGSLLASGGALAVALAVMMRAPAAPAALPTPAAPAAAPVTAKLDELTVGRLNVVEPDGTPRMIISSRARFPGDFSRGTERPRPDRRYAAGILFVDDEGTENGGLIQAGVLDPAGKVQAGLSLTFDRFRQDQMLQLLLQETDDAARAGVQINDRPSYKVFSIDDLRGLAHDLEQLPPAERDATIARHRALGHLGAPRGYFGTRDGSAKLVLSDPQGRPRLTLSVSDRGEPSIELLDEAGHSVRTLDAHKP